MEYKKSEASDSGEFLNKMELGDEGEFFVAPVDTEPPKTSDMIYFVSYDGSWKKLGKVSPEFQGFEDDGGSSLGTPNLPIATASFGSDGAPVSSSKGVIRDLIKALPGLEQETGCPGYGKRMVAYSMECVEVPMTISYMIQHLNDDHRWSREAIADWLETLDADLSFPVPGETDPRQG